MMPLRLNRKLQIRKNTAPLATLILLIFFSSYYGIVYCLESIDLVHEPPHDCTENDQKIAFCEQRYFDDGHVRISSISHEQPNCCIMERLMIDHNRLSYRVLACDRLDRSPIQCSAVESYGIGAWRIDGRELKLDLTWDRHQSEYIQD